MKKGKLSVYTSCYSTTYGSLGVHGELSCRLEMLSPEGDEYSTWSEIPEDAAKAAVQYHCGVTLDRLSEPRDCSLRFDSYRADSKRLLAAARLMEAAEKKLAAIDEEDGPPSSLAEAIRRGCRAFGITHLIIEGPEKEFSVCRGRYAEDLPVRELVAFAAAWTSRLADLATQVREEAKKDEMATAEG